MIDGLAFHQDWHAAQAHQRCKQRSLALDDGQARPRANVAETQNRGSIGNHRDAA